MRYRVEYGWGDRGQALYAHFEAESEEQAKQTAIALLHRIRINGAWIVHQNGDTSGSETHVPGVIRSVDHTRWLNP
jgi:hypothetical protein